LQIRIAANEKLPLLQDDVQFRGHAIECRLYAEDPDNHYFPSPGRITLLQETAGPGIRLDTGVYEGWTVPNDYDPLLAKLIGYGQDRDHAISRLLRALDEIFVGGIHTNLSLFRKILNDTAFQAGKIDTGYLERLLASSPVSEIHEHSQVAAIAAVLFNVLDSTIKGRSIGTTSSNVAESNWKRAARTESSEISEQFVWRGHSCPRRLDRSCSWKCPNTYDMVYNVNIGGRNLRIALERTGETWKCELDGVQVQLDARPIRPDVISLILEGAAYEVKRDQLGNHTRLWINNTPFIAEITDPRSLAARSRVATSTSAKVLASMPGKVLRVMVRAMDQVEVGQALLVLEAMKMQNEIKSPNKGIVKQLMTEGDYVNAGDVLAIVE
jgi:acetyl/propionyl-CoA carboxylase alpha subunit